MCDVRQVAGPPVSSGHYNDKAMAASSRCLGRELQTIANVCAEAYKAMSPVFASADDDHFSYI